MLKHKIKLQKKNWRRKRADVHQSLDVQWRVQPDVALPYGCKTNADVFTAVNEMYDSLAAPDSPGPDWAQSIRHSNESEGIHKGRASINLLKKAANMRTSQAAKCISNVPDDRNMWFSTTQASVESLFLNARVGLADITIKLPDTVCCLQT